MKKSYGKVISTDASIETIEKIKDAICPECGLTETVKFTDKPKFEIVCTKCGLVVDGSTRRRLESQWSKLEKRIDWTGCDKDIVEKVKWFFILIKDEPSVNINDIVLTTHLSAEVLINRIIIKHIDPQNQSILKKLLERTSYRIKVDILKELIDNRDLIKRLHKLNEERNVVAHSLDTMKIIKKADDLKTKFSLEEECKLMRDLWLLMK